MNRNFQEWRLDVLKEYVFWHRTDDEAWGIYLERNRPHMRPSPDLDTEAGRQEFANIIQQKEQEVKKRGVAEFEAMTLADLRNYGMSHMDKIQVWKLYFERLGIHSFQPLPPDPVMAHIADIVRAGFSKWK
ncbi:MAG: hypothetical protein KME05_02900 [Gloeocapsa sp. UFS-A4-WI-NPMV-4B04]|jgi:hypothetical protein|nr:hypothetical protein [Gloeocapsa sp. UFS-A4-WI-NPMV-4B04]